MRGWGALIEDMLTDAAAAEALASTHEGYGVLAEEIAELFEAVRLLEEIQVAAVALRLSLGKRSTK